MPSAIENEQSSRNYAKRYNWIFALYSHAKFCRDHAARHIILKLSAIRPYRRRRYLSISMRFSWLHTKNRHGHQSTSLPRSQLLTPNAIHAGFYQICLRSNFTQYYWEHIVLIVMWIQLIQLQAYCVRRCFFFFDIYMCAKRVVHWQRRLTLAFCHILFNRILVASGSEIALRPLPFDQAHSLRRRLVCTCRVRSFSSGDYSWLPSPSFTA